MRDGHDIARSIMFEEIDAVLNRKWIPVGIHPTDYVEVMRGAAAKATRLADAQAKINERDGVPERK